MWYNKIGYDNLSLQTQYTFDLQKGFTYELRYRVYNMYGWSDFSPITTFIAADIPSEPLAPTLVSVDSTQITIELDMLTIDNGGLPLTEYVLEITSDSLVGFI